MEIWKDIPGYEGYYKVSSYGQVIGLCRIVGFGKDQRTERERYLKPQRISNGYLRTALTKGGKRQRLLIHRLVAMTFIPNPNNKSQVNHIDGDKLNNNVDNLEWMSNSENSIHREENILFYSKLTPDVVLEIRRLKDNFSYEKLSSMFGVSQGHLINIIKKRCWKHI